MYIVFYTSSPLVASQPFPTRTRQHGPANDYQWLAHFIHYSCIDKCLPDVHLIFIYHMSEESTNDNGAEEIRVVSHRDEHELRHKGKKKVSVSSIS